MGGQGGRLGERSTKEEPSGRQRPSWVFFSRGLGGGWVQRVNWWVVLGGNRASAELGANSPTSQSSHKSPKSPKSPSPSISSCSGR